MSESAPRIMNAILKEQAKALLDSYDLAIDHAISIVKVHKPDGYMDIVESLESLKKEREDGDE